VFVPRSREEIRAELDRLERDFGTIVAEYVKAVGDQRAIINPQIFGEHCLRLVRRYIDLENALGAAPGVA
jgi:hypothetical protein